ncbi:hypothetical protein SKAU_G00293440 [Synaphobranchus kaupii]|uniref:BZIP domain-containing protein n=1 Tax=Synaphobranchus kaupii TaxID=118154 RepID=A0A9Q1EU84_SYNKA|nr:hypothetical protein SKAU_G00293440 [Synaphobranchus kaupii]
MHLDRVTGDKQQFTIIVHLRILPFDRRKITQRWGYCCKTTSRWDVSAQYTQNQSLSFSKFVLAWEKQRCAIRYYSLTHSRLRRLATCARGKLGCEAFEMFEENCQEIMQQSAGLLQTLGSTPPPGEALSFTDEAVNILTSSSLLARSLLAQHSALRGKEPAATPADSTEAARALRCKREFIPEDEKDNGYWDKRRKNNEAAKRSREKRRCGSSVGSPVFFDDRHVSEHGKPRFEPHPCPTEGETLGGDAPRGASRRPDSVEGMKSLPHKLRFKTQGARDSSGTVGGDSRRSPTHPMGARDIPRESITGHLVPGGAAEEGQQSLQPGKVSQLPDSQYQAENHGLHSQLTSLSREVAELKRLFSQQLLPKTN